jgi:hypothetical protein
MPETINATVTKQAESDRVGIRLVSGGEGGKIFVDATTGLFGETGKKQQQQQQQQHCCSVSSSSTFILFCSQLTPSVCCTFCSLQR